MVRKITQFRITKVLIIMLTALHLFACGSGGSSSTTTTNGGLVQSSNVTPQPSSLSLSWLAPVIRTDGSPISLADIGGYKIYYGSSAGNYTDSVDVIDGSQTSVTIKGLPAGTYHMVMTTYDINGLESPYSSEVLKTTL